jgi:hypothetical protein
MSLLELRRDQLPAELDLGDTFFWEGASYRVRSIGSSSVAAERVIEPGQKPVAPAAPAEPAVQEAGEPIVEAPPPADAGQHPQAPAISADMGIPITEAPPVVEAAKPVEIADIPAEHDLASKQDVTALAARLDALVWMVTATMAGTLVILWKLLLRWDVKAPDA